MLPTLKKRNRETKTTMPLSQRSIRRRKENDFSPDFSIFVVEEDPLSYSEAMRSHDVVFGSFLL